VEAAHAVADVARRIAPAQRASGLALFCDASETALLATIFAATAARGHFEEFACALAERVPALAGAEFAIESREGEPARTVAQWGAKSIRYRAAGFEYRVDHGAFFQVNRWLVDALIDRVTANQAGAAAWDLFAGVGLFARRLTSNFERVLAVESAPAATAALAHNLSGTAGTAVKADTLAFLRRNRRSPRPDLIVADPPRTGLGAEVCALLGEIAAPAMVYVSCDPATLARDLRALIAAGYAMESIVLADLFPQTFHLETIVHLRRVSTGA
jgi:23S rRNA (uracil1939-C5)-methyltransferase